MSTKQTNMMPKKVKDVPEQLQDDEAAIQHKKHIYTVTPTLKIAGIGVIKDKQKPKAEKQVLNGNHFGRRVKMHMEMKLKLTAQKRKIGLIEHFFGFLCSAPIPDGIIIAKKQFNIEITGTKVTTKCSLESLKNMICGGDGSKGLLENLEEGNAQGAKEDVLKNVEVSKTEQKKKGEEEKEGKDTPWLKERHASFIKFESVSEYFKSCSKKKDPAAQEAADRRRQSRAVQEQQEDDVDEDDFVMEDLPGEDANTELRPSANKTPTVSSPESEVNSPLVQGVNPGTEPQAPGTQSRVPMPTE